MKLTKFVPTLEEISGRHAWRYDQPAEITEALEESEKTGEWRGVSGLPSRKDAVLLVNQTRARMYRQNYGLKIKTRTIQRADETWAIILKVEERL